MRKYLLIILFISTILSDTYGGLTLITNMGGGGQGGGNQPKYSHLIDIDENIINSWEHNTSPASIAYLMPDSILYIPCKIGQGGGGQGGGPNGGRFKKMDWDGNIIWDYYLPEDICNPHHDIAVLPNGNILAICSETKTQEEALSAGLEGIFGPMTLDMIIEIHPEENNEATIVWEWHFWDHLIQDVSNEYANYGNISENPHLLDINCTGNGDSEGIRDWNHSNCISYNAIFDQVVISSRHMNEFFIIDHSTTTLEAASHTGGNFGKGGDFLYRWGNSENYGRGDNSNQILFAQHSVNWIPEGYPGHGNIILFNNNHNNNNNSAVLEIGLPVDSDGFYFINDDEPFGPSSYLWIYQNNFYSNSQSGAFRLPNGNTIITSANEQNIFEVNYLGESEWEYSGDFVTARAIKYPLDYFENTSILGDINSDGTINVLDIVLVVNIILGLSELDDSADINFDGVINILDIVQLVNLIII